MRKYIVNFERKGEIISTFTIHADNLKEAKRIAQTHKRGKTCKTIVYPL